MKKCSDARLSRLMDDPYLDPFRHVIEHRRERVESRARDFSAAAGSLPDFASGHEHFGLRFHENQWVFREWAPNAERIFLKGDFSGWQEDERFRLKPSDEEKGVWEIFLPPDAIQHGQQYRLSMYWPGGHGDRIPAWARRAVQDPETKSFNAQVWQPPEQYRWRNSFARPGKAPLIYEAHIGIAQEEEKVGSFLEFADRVLPRIREAGYNTVQLMGLMEHPYYGSFGYHVSSFFAASSRFGSPEELKELIDRAHGMGLAVIMDLVHSHAVKNEIEGLSRFDGTLYQYFHEGDKGSHPGWDSRCFDYGKNEVQHFLLSNCRYWLDEFRVDGFRFDGITSMLYHHRGLASAFSSYEDYFSGAVDEDAYVYLALANSLIHELRPDALTIAEDVSGMPGLAAPVPHGGCGFDYRLAMGTPDCWFKLVNDVADENWDVNYLWRELQNRRGDEKTISYAESHDQALVGGKSLAFELMDAEMYEHMSAGDDNLAVDRGMALHKMIRMLTACAAPFGYMNFMGNEFGHPEWIDFPREGNGWSYHYARRQWRLRDDPALKYHFLADFDSELVKLLEQSDLLENSQACGLCLDNDRKIIIFGRRDFIFGFNFHPSESYTGFEVTVPFNTWQHELDTDEQRFGGHARLEPGMVYNAEPVENAGSLDFRLRLYLPARSALALRKARP